MFHQFHKKTLVNYFITTEMKRSDEGFIVKP